MPARPKLSRRLQLRRAKQAQRSRERAAGLVHLQLALPRPLAAKLRLLHRRGELVPALGSLTDTLVVRVADFPGLQQVAWNLHEEYLSAAEAFALYERNWKLLDLEHLDEKERALLDGLTVRFGAGVINA